MLCPYNNFKNMDCSECGARMWTKDPTNGHLMRVCAIAYNGGNVVVVKTEPPKED